VRLLEQVEKRGEEFLIGLMRKMLDVAEAGAYQKTKALPDGKFRAVVFNDAIGWTPALVRSCFLTLIRNWSRRVSSKQRLPQRHLAAIARHQRAESRLDETDARRRSNGESRSSGDFRE
jgi:hypothetical protein